MAKKRTPHKPEMRTDYLSQSARPLTSLAFVLPFLIFYEIGALMLSPESARNGADVWLREFLGLLGFGQYLLLPFATVAILLGWHHTKREPWRVRPKVVGCMFVESAIWGGALLLVAMLLGNMFTLLPSLELISDGFISRVIGPFGAGLYEELLFRLILLPIVFGCMKAAGWTDRASWFVAIVLTSLLFSAAHYKIFSSLGDEFELYSFSFRFVAGACFSLLFIFRGFGIAVGAHALYDVFVTMLKMFEG